MTIKTKRVFEIIISDISEKYKINFTTKQKNEIWYAIKNQIPILFIGEPRTGKTLLAKELQKYGVTAYAPEMISVIGLGDMKPKEMREIFKLTDLGTH